MRRGRCSTRSELLGGAECSLHAIDVFDACEHREAVGGIPKTLASHDLEVLLRGVVQRLLEHQAPDYAVVDLKLAGDASGLACVQYLHAQDPETVIVVLTGYASIATAVEAIKLGARHYLAKPANTDDIEAAFSRALGDTGVELTDRQTSIKTLEWERIHEMLAETGFNISETARRLGMHRRTLARKLEKQRIK